MYTAIMPIRPNQGFRPETTTNSKRAREMSNTLGNASKEGNDTHGRHRRRPGKSRARFSSEHHTFHHLEGIGQHHPRCFAPPPPQRLAVVAA